MKFDIRPCTIGDVKAMCEQFHGYGSASNAATYAFGVYETGKIVACYAWQPPPPGAALSVCPEAPAGVLSLSRMVAVPRDARLLKHISKPLKLQMSTLIDRGRWPVLVTYSDEGQGHNGYVYQCSGWTPTTRSVRETFEDPATRARASRYSAGFTGKRELERTGTTTIQRWEHWACARGEAARHMELHGWSRESAGKRYANGKHAFTWTKQADLFSSVSA